MKNTIGDDTTRVRESERSLVVFGNLRLFSKSAVGPAKLLVRGARVCCLRLELCYCWWARSVFWLLKIAPTRKCVFVWVSKVALWVCLAYFVFLICFWLLCWLTFWGWIVHFACFGIAVVSGEVGSVKFLWPPVLLPVSNCQAIVVTTELFWGR